MLKKPITFTDFNGKTHTKNYYFNLSAAELIKLEMSTMTISEDMESTTGGLQAHIQDVIDSRQGKRIIEMFDMFVDASYGVRSEDGLKFYKEGVLADFKASPAYDALFMQLVTDANFGSEFLNGIMPKELIDQAETLKAEQPVADVTPISPNLQAHLGIEDPSGPSEEDMVALWGGEMEGEEKDYTKLSRAEFRALPKTEKMIAFRQKQALLNQK